VIDLTQTEEVICSTCGKPLMFTELSPGSFRFDGCHCVGLHEVTIPVGAIITNFGGAWVLRRPKQRKSA